MSLASIMQKLVGQDFRQDPAWKTFIQSQGLQPGQNVGEGRLRELQQQFSQYVQQKQAAPALAQVLAQQGMGPGTPQLDPTTGRYRTPVDPEAAAAVSLMMKGAAGNNPALMGMGASNAASLLQPGRAMDAERLSLSRDRLALDQQIEQRMSQVDPYEEERLRIAREREQRMRLKDGRLPIGQVDEIIKEEAVDAGLEAAAEAMRPDFFGYGFDSVGRAAEEYKRRTGSDTEFTTFWNEFNTFQAGRRYELFGATLTDNEQAEWNRLSVQPSDSFAAAKAKLAAQQRAIARKREARSKILRNAGYQDPTPAPAPSRPPLNSYWGQ